MKQTAVHRSHAPIFASKLSALFLPACALLLLALAGCESRSISDSGYRGGGFGRADSGSYTYRGELTESDVIGTVTPTGPITDADIQRALNHSRPVHAAPGTGLVVVQSGAVTPDDAMLTALDRRYHVQSFSGVPPDEADRAEYSKRLRLAAAQGRFQHILCYWGTLESAREDQVTKTLSWVPIAGSFLPDETQKMRLNLHAVLIDVATGHWSSYTGKPAEDEALSAGIVRRSSDQKQVAKLKATAYTSLVDELVARAS